MQLSPETLKAIDVATEHFLKATSLDMEILSDELKYSLWLSTLAAAGTAFVLSQSAQTIAIPLAYRLAGFAFACAIVFGAWITKLVNRNLAEKRLLITLFGKQRALAACGEVAAPPTSDLYTHVMNGGFLAESDRSALKMRFLKWQTSLPFYLLALQSIVLAFAYSAALTRLM